MTTTTEPVGNVEWTVSGEPRIRYSTKETAILIRAALKAAFPGVKFSVTTSYASTTSSTNVRWTDGPTVPEVDHVTNNYTSRGFDGMTDSTTYHEQSVNGQRVSYSGWVHTSRDVSAALLQKALDRYNMKRAQYGHGPAQLEVKSNGRYSHLDGLDRATMNPCGGSATWCPDAVHQIAYHMRPNGCMVTMKSRF